MKRALLLLALFVVGCGGPQTAIQTPDGKVTVQDGKTTIQTDDGKTVTSTTDGQGNVEVKSSDGTSMKMSDGKVETVEEKGNKASLGVLVSEAEVGYPFYPGATVVEHGSSKVESDGKTNFMITLTTADSPSKVTDFYKGNFDPKDLTTMTQGESSILGGHWKNGEEGAVTASVEDGKTKIILTVARKK